MQASTRGLLAGLVLDKWLRISLEQTARNLEANWIIGIFFYMLMDEGSDVF